MLYFKLFVTLLLLVTDKDARVCVVTGGESPGNRRDSPRATNSPRDASRTWPGRRLGRKTTHNREDDPPIKDRLPAALTPGKLCVPRHVPGGQGDSGQVTNARFTPRTR